MGVTSKGGGVWETEIIFTKRSRWKRKSKNIMFFLIFKTQVTHPLLIFLKNKITQGVPYYEKRIHEDEGCGDKKCGVEGYNPNFNIWYDI